MISMLPLQRKLLDFWNFYESNLMEARFEMINSLPFYLNNDGNIARELHVQLYHQVVFRLLCCTFR